MNKVFTKLQFFFQVIKQCQRISAFYKQNRLMTSLQSVAKKEKPWSGIMQLLQKLLCF